MKLPFQFRHYLAFGLLLLLGLAVRLGAGDGSGQVSAAPVAPAPLASLR